MNKETINWGIISTGRIAREMTDALKLVKDAQLIAVSSRDVERAASFSRE
jgi:predicted dehydrogenase